MLKARLDAKGRATFGVFWDFASLHQHSKDAKRDAHEEMLFKEGLDSLAQLYAHERTYVLRLTRQPEGYPSGYKGVGKALPYEERGWCFTETAWAQLTKPFDMSLDIGLYTGSTNDWDAIKRECTQGARRPPPRTPEEFTKQLEHKTFTNEKDDRLLTSRLYHDMFERQMQSAGVLRYRRLGWSDIEAEQLSLLISDSRGLLRNVHTIDLSHNNISDSGVLALAAAMDEGHVPKLAVLNLNGNPASEDAIENVMRSITYGMTSLQVAGMTPTRFAQELQSRGLGLSSSLTDGD